MHPPPRPSSCVQVPAASLPPKDRCPESQSLSAAAVGRSRQGGSEQDEFMRGFRYLLVVAPIAALVAAAPALAAQRYTVRWGDTLTGIASANGVSLHHLARANHIRPGSLLLAGTTLRIPGHGHSGPRRPRLPGPGGDTLSGIAARYGITLTHLAAINGISPFSVLLAGSHL